MTDAAEDLQQLRPENSFFIGIDSDGCVFDTMEIKQKECFCPQFVNHFGMQPVSKYARETWEFVNLYSRTRGVNRFPAVMRSLALIGEREEVRARHVDVPAMEGLGKWLERETKLGNATLAAEVERNPDPDLCHVLAWSEDVNAAVKKIVRNVPPFPFVRESFARFAARADAMVCSQTPTEALEREWQEHGIAGFVRVICGQEVGTKTEHIQHATSGRYDSAKCLMIGDAPGDFRAAQANGILFYPINPGDEEASWRRFHDEAIERFFSGSYAGEYERGLLDEFERYLPEEPPWRT